MIIATLGYALSGQIFFKSLKLKKFSDIFIARLNNFCHDLVNGNE